MSYVIASTHPAFGKMYLGRHSPVKSRASALRFRDEASAKDRIEWWQRCIERDQLDPKFFGNLYVEEVPQTGREHPNHKRS